MSTELDGRAVPRGVEEQFASPDVFSVVEVRAIRFHGTLPCAVHSERSTRPSG